MAEQAAQAASRTQGAEQAGQQYQQAAAAPMPQLNPMAALIQSLGGNVASIIGETPRYAQNAQADLNAQKDELLAKRAQNLSALKDNYDRQAMAAASAGDLLAEAKLRKSAESVSKAWQAIHDEAAFKQANSLADKNNAASASEGVLDRASREKIAAMAANSKKSESGPGSEVFKQSVRDWAETINNGGARLTAIRDPIERRAVMSLMTELGYHDMPPAARAGIEKLSGSIETVKQLADLAIGPIGPDGKTRTGGILSAQPGVGNRLKQGLSLTGGSITQSPGKGADTSVYESAAKGFLVSLAKMSGQGGALSDQDLAYAKSLLPTKWTTGPVAVRNFELLDALLQSRINGIIRSYSTPLTGPQAGVDGPGVTPDVSKVVSKKTTVPEVWVKMIEPKTNRVIEIRGSKVPEYLLNDWKRAPTK
jgi:hypothetical protein